MLRVQEVAVLAGPSIYARCPLIRAVVSIEGGATWRMGPVNAVLRDACESLFPDLDACSHLHSLLGRDGVHVAAILARSGLTVGATMSEGVFIDRVEMARGDLSGPHAARQVLQDPRVDAAVLESARRGLIKWGLGFDHCDVAAVLNVIEDHLGVMASTALRTWRRSNGCWSRWRVAR